METKNKIVKMARVCHVVTKVLYLVSIAVCLAFTVLAIVLPNTDAIVELHSSEVAVLFATMALYAFICIGLLWNVEGLFKSIVQEQSPFNDGVSHYLKKIAIFILVISIVPALVGTAVVRIVYPASELAFPIEVGGIISGVVLFIFGVFFKYGKELQSREDETL